MPVQLPFRKPFLLACLLLITVTLTSCGRSDPTPELASEPAELTWVTLDVSSQVENTLAANYRETNPHITFQRQSLDLSRDYVGLSPAPDIIMSFANRAYVAAGAANQLADLSEVWANAALDEALIPNVQTLVQDRDSGKPHMLPVAFAWAAIYYNQELFAQYNLQPPQTWNELIEICAILQANGEIPLAMVGSESYADSLWFDYLNLRINGAAYHRDLLEGRERFDDPRVALVLETWRSLFQQDFVVPRPELMGATEAVHALVRSDDGLLGGEKAAMVLVDTTTLSGVDPDFRQEIGFFRFPIIDPSVAVAESVDVIGYLIPANAPHRPQAQEFLTYLGSRQSQTLIAAEASVINAVFAPVRSDIEAETLTAEMSQAIAMLQEAEEVVPFSYQSMPAPMWDEFSRAYRQLLTDKQDIQRFMDAMESARQAALSAGLIE